MGFERGQKKATKNAEMTCSRRLFQTRAAATEKARSPTTDSRMRLTISDEDELEICSRYLLWLNYKTRILKSNDFGIFYSFRKFKVYTHRRTLRKLRCKGYSVVVLHPARKCDQDILSLSYNDTLIQHIKGAKYTAHFRPLFYKLSTLNIYDLCLSFTLHFIY